MNEKQFFHYYEMQYRFKIITVYSIKNRPILEEKNISFSITLILIHLKKRSSALEGHVFFPHLV